MNQTARSALRIGFGILWGLGSFLAFGVLGELYRIDLGRLENPIINALASTVFFPAWAGFYIRQWIWPEELASMTVWLVLSVAIGLIVGTLLLPTIYQLIRPLLRSD